jgi:ribose 5-phosphate isomerase RpiB
VSLFSKIGSIFHAGEQKVVHAVQHPVQQVLHPVEHMIAQGVHPVVAQAIHAVQQAQQVAPRIQPPHIQAPHIQMPNIHIPNTPISTKQVGQGLSAASHAISKQSNKLNSTKVGKFANQNIIQPSLKTDSNVGQVLQGKNPYHGTKRQIAGQVGNDALNMASVIPVGRGAEFAAQGTKAAIRQGLKSGAKAGAGYGAAYGTTQSLQDKNATAKTYAKNIGLGLGAGLLTGTALGVGAPVAGAVAKGVGREIKAGLPHAQTQRGSVPLGPEQKKAKEVIDSLVSDHASMLKDAQKQAGGVNGVWTPDGKFVKQSRNSREYSAAYKKNGKAPGNDFYVEQAHKQLQTSPTPEGELYRQAQAHYEAHAQPEFLKHYTPSKNPSKDEQFALKYLTENHDKAKADYLARVKKEFGSTNIVGGDDVKHIIPNFGPTKSAAYHEPASAFAKQIYHELLADPKTVGKPVVITAGGTGAGKTTGLMKIKSLKDAAAVVDTNLTDMKGAESRIGAARNSGRPVHVQYVYRDPVEAFKGVMNRGKSTGRIVQPATHVETHAGSHETLQQLAQKYGNDPNVNIDMHHNVGKGVLKPLTLDEHKALSYNREELANKIRGALDEAHQNNQITSQEHQAYLGSQVPRLDKTVQPGIPAKPLQEPSQVRQNRFTQGVTNSPEVSPQVQSAVSGQHVQRSTAGLVENADEIIATHGLDKTTQTVHDALAVPNGKIDDQDVANAIKVAKANDVAGNHDAATSIYNALSDHLVHAGRTIQAAAILARRTPEGIYMKAMKDLKKAGVPTSEAIKKELKAGVEQIKKTAENSPEREQAVAEYRKLVAKHIPSSITDKTLGIWKAGLLSGTKTQGGNFLSNGAFGVLKKASDIPATALDKGISLFTGKRTKTLTTGAQTAQGALEGTKKGWATLKTGIDARNLGEDKYQHSELNFKNPVLNKYVNGVFRLMSAGDQPFYYGALRDNLKDIAKADALTKGLKGAEQAAHVKDFLKNPSEAAFQTATDAAEKAVLGQDSALSRGVTKAVQAIPGGKVVVPFTKVPTNFLTRTLDYTPVGAVKEAVSQIKKGSFNQRSLVEALGEATTGSAVIYLGSELAGSNRLSGDYPNDAKEQARWKAEGITPNSIKLGGNWVSLNYLGPAGLLLGAGKNMHEAVQNGDNAAMQGIAGLGKGLEQQSFLQGLSGFSNALSDPGRYGSNLIKSQTASVVPALVNDVGNATDSMQRQANGVGQALMGRIPGLRNTLNPKQDAFGNDLKQAGGSGFNTAVNPLKPSKITSTDVTNEIDRLKATGKDNFVMPTPDKALTVGKETVKLNGDQQYKYTKYAGQQIQDKWSQIIKDPTYAKLSDDDKATTLASAMKDINAVSKVQFLSSIGKNDLANQAADKLTKTQYKILTGGALSAADYAENQQIKANTPKGKSATTPKSTYQTAVDKYNKDKSKMSSIDQMKTEKSLATLKIKSDYSQDVIDFYNLSNTDKNAFFKRDPSTAKSLYAQAKELQAKLTGTGLTAKNVSTKVKGIRGTKTAKIGTSKRTRVAKTKIVKPPKLTIRNSKILVKGTKTSSPKISTAGYVKAKNVSSSSKAPRLYA